MNFSRMHVGILGIVSIFTGTISPIGMSQNGNLYPIPLTNFDIFGYVLLLILITISILLSVQKWKWIKFFLLIGIIILGYILVSLHSGNIMSLNEEQILSYSWGWIFYIIGMGTLIWASYEKDTSWEKTSLGDHVIGWIVAAILFGLTGLIMGAAYMSRHSSDIGILKKTFGTGTIISMSGVTMSPTYDAIASLSFERSSDRLSFFGKHGNTYTWVPKNITYQTSPEDTIEIEGKTYFSLRNAIFTETGAELGVLLKWNPLMHSILYWSHGSLSYIHNNVNTTYTGVTDPITHVAINEQNDVAWVTKSGTGYQPWKNGEKFGGIYHTIRDISLSESGESHIMIITEAEDGTAWVERDGIKIEKIGTGYKEGSLRMNGISTLYAREQDGYIVMVADGKVIDKKFDEVREIFLYKNGSGYAFFGRPLGEKTYCLYTKYKGNLCNLHGYMNPVQSRDGSNILYAGLRDGNWGIYSNASALIKNTLYPNHDDIRYDYVFFDITNPRYYVFLKKEGEYYKIYKEGEWVPGIWKDVGLDVHFGYDGKVIMSAKDDTGWRILEF